MPFRKFLHYVLLLSFFACSKKNSPPPIPKPEEPELSKSLVYFGGRDNVLYAIDVETGKKRWSVAVQDSIFSSPIAGNGMVYFGVGTGKGIDDNLYALDALTGEKKWTFSLPEGTYSSPVIKDKIVYINALKNSYAIDALTGKEIWSDKDMSTPIISPLVADNTLLLLCPYNIRSLAKNNGKENWIKYPFENSFFVGNPVINNDLIYVAKKEYYYPNGKLTALNLTTGEEKWVFKVKGNDYMHTCIVNNTICIGEGQNLVGLDLLTGNEHWRIKTNGKETYNISNILAAEDMIYLFNGSGAIEAYDLNTKTKKWEYKNISGYDYPTLANGTLYFFGIEKLVAVDAKTGQEKWAYNPDIKWFSSWNSPCVVLEGDKVYRGMGNIKP